MCYQTLPVKASLELLKVNCGMIFHLWPFSAGVASWQLRGLIAVQPICKVLHASVCSQRQEDIYLQNCLTSRTECYLNLFDINHTSWLFLFKINRNNQILMIEQFLTQKSKRNFHITSENSIIFPSRVIFF